MSCTRLRYTTLFRSQRNNGVGGAEPGMNSAPDAVNAELVGDFINRGVHAIGADCKGDVVQSHHAPYPDTTAGRLEIGGFLPHVENLRLRHVSCSGAPHYPPAAMDRTAGPRPRPRYGLRGALRLAVRPVHH